MSLRIKRDDMVMVISGRDKGAQGRVMSVDPKAGTAIVEGLNMRKKHQKARSQEQPGGILEIEAPLPLSKLMLAVPGGKGGAARFRTEVDDKGNKVRVLKLGDDSKKVTV